MPFRAGRNTNLGGTIVSRPGQKNDLRTLAEWNKQDTI